MKASAVREAKPCSSITSATLAEPRGLDAARVNIFAIFETGVNARCLVLIKNAQRFSSRSTPCGLP